MQKSKIKFSSHISEKIKNSKKKILSKKLHHIFDEIKNYEIEDQTLSVLKKNFNFNFNYNQLKKFKKFKSIALIGMGGSILGSEAIYGFLQKKIRRKIYFLNNLDPEQIKILKKKELSKILFIVISKSGNTIETLSNMFSLNIIKKNTKNVIIITEKNNNLLCSLSKKLNIFFIEHKNYIGGRYSVLSEVGIVPAYLMGINISKLRSQTELFFSGKKKTILKNSVIELVHLLNSKRVKSLIFLNYSPELEKLLFWCQQLIAESLGKKGLGFLPVISNVPRDHHSLLQLYLDGPQDKIFYIFSVENKTNIKIKVNKSKRSVGSKHFLNNKTLSKVKEAQKIALIKTLRKKNISYREFKISKINEENLGELFVYFMLETVLTGKLLKINPFDQPAVEQVKIYTKNFLS